MQPPDFLHQDAETRFRECFIAAGATCMLATNSEQILEAARSTFQTAERGSGRADFRLRFWVDEATPSQATWPKPYVRGLGHLVYAGFDEGSSMLADLHTCRVIGRFSAEIAADIAYWRTVIFPMLLSIVGASVGIAELHCACVANGQDGVLLAGASGAGKSTLAFALAHQGSQFLSDDRTFCSIDAGEVQAWGAPTALKLRPEAAQWFGQLQEKPLTNARSGGPAFWLDPGSLVGVRRARNCRPTSLIFLERRETSQFQLTPMPPADALSRLNGELMAELPEAIVKRSKTIKKVAELPSWLLRYGGDPHKIAQQISRHLAQVEPVTGK